MTKRVVHHLEFVEVEKQNRCTGICAASCNTFKRLFDAIAEKCTIGQSSERIVKCPVYQARFESLAVSHVAKDRLDCRTAFVDDLDRRSLDFDHPSVRTRDPVFNAFGRMADTGRHSRPVVRMHELQRRLPNQRCGIGNADEGQPRGVHLHHLPASMDRNRLWRCLNQQTVARLALGERHLSKLEPLTPRLLFGKRQENHGLTQHRNARDHCCGDGADEDRDSVRLPE